MAISKILTDSAVKAAKPKEKPYKLSDTGRLYLLVSTAGSKYWKWNYRLDEKDCTYTLGEYPDVGLQKARELRDAARKIVADGIHPAEHKKQQIRQRKQEAATTFWGVTEEWILFKKTLWTPSYLKQVETFMGRYVRDGELGSLPIGKITSADIVSLVRGVAQRKVNVGEERKSAGAPTVAINLRQWCSAVFRFAIVSGKLAVNPIGEIQLKDVVTRPRVKNNRPLKPEEIRELLRVLKEYKFGTRAVRIAVELLLLTFVRTGELRMATWDEFDLKAGLWTIPAIRMKIKDGGDHVVPLSRQVIALLRELLQMRGLYITKPKPDWVFPNARRPEACMSATTVNRALERMGFNGKDSSIGFAAHGFRGTASTLLNEQGMRHKVIEFQLAHKEKNKVSNVDVQYVKRGTLYLGHENGRRHYCIYDKRKQLMETGGGDLGYAMSRVEVKLRPSGMLLQQINEIKRPFGNLLVLRKSQLSVLKKKSPLSIELDAFVKAIAKGATAQWAYLELDSYSRKLLLTLLRPPALKLNGSVLHWEKWISMQQQALEARFLKECHPAA